MHNARLRRLLPTLAASAALLICLLVLTGHILRADLSVRSARIGSGAVKINLNDGAPVFRAQDLLLAPGAFVEREFFIENVGTADLFYRLYPSELCGELADVLTVTIRDGDTVLYDATLSALESSPAADDILHVGQRKYLTIRLFFPPSGGNALQNTQLSFALCAEATQVRNNAERVFD